MTIAWFSYFPIEWLPGVPDEVAAISKQHPATWQRVLLAELRRSPGVNLHVIVLRKDFARDLSFEQQGVNFHLIRTRGGMRAPSLFWYDTVLLQKRLRAIRPDVVHAWGTENGAASVASRLSYPSVVTIQGLASWNVTRFPVSGYERVAAWLERWSLRRGGLVTAESTFACDFLRRHLPKLEVRHVDTVPDPLFHQISRTPAPGKFRILFSGHLGPRKGGDLILRALDRLGSTFDYELVVIGASTPEFLQQMKTETSPSLWTRVRFRQNLQPDEVADELGRTTIFACPTRADTGPTAAKEAAVAGVPIVGAEIGGVPDYVLPGRNGFLFPAGDVDGLVGALRQTASHPMFSRGMVPADALAEIRARLAPERMAQGFRSAYDRAIQRKNE